jgi:hypothetical protein
MALADWYSLGLRKAFERLKSEEYAFLALMHNKTKPCFGFEDAFIASQGVCRGDEPLTGPL